ncbi:MULTISPECIES: cold shock domain-containing protein CspD [unclassified Pseudomonas]|uniref:cold shock domain-containing protein CspD n=1 Tax=Pseudomonas imrae TaxID=2992837 RepID=UPI003965D1A8
MASGKVKWFNNVKGFGFINEDGKDEDLFVHHSAIEMDGYRTLKAGQTVTFEINQGPKGLQAVKIECITTTEKHVEKSSSEQFDKAERTMLSKKQQPA